MLLKCRLGCGRSWGAGRAEALHFPNPRSAPRCWGDGHILQRENLGRETITCAQGPGSAVHRAACAAHRWLEAPQNTHGRRLAGHAADGLLLCSFMSKGGLRACSPLLSQGALTLPRCLMSSKCLQGIWIKHPSHPPPHWEPVAARLMLKP